MRMLLTAALAALAMANPAVAAAAPVQSVVNLAHLDFLHDSVPYPTDPPPGHSTTEPGVPIDTWWVYANYDPATGGYRRVGGGAYDPATGTYGQGAFDTDDVSRAAVVYLTHFRQYHDRHSLDMARGALRFVLYMQTTTGPNAGNFVLWMQPSGALNPSPDPPDSPNPSDAGASYWMARSIWALGEGYATFRDLDRPFAAVLAGRMRLAVHELESELVGPRFGSFATLHGYRTPSWLIADGADASSEALLGLTAFVAASGDPEARQLADELGQGIAADQFGDPRDWPWQALMPWTLSVSDWHAWGAHMAAALAEAAGPLGRPGWLAAATRDAASFELHQQLSFGPINGLLPAPDDLTQIAYGDETTVDGLLRVGEATGRDVFQRWAGVAAGWLLGDNPAHRPMYDPASGVVLDGIGGDGAVNRNSGAESTIEGLLALMEVERDPVARRYLGYDTAVSSVSYRQVQAESGQLSGEARVVVPSSSWTGEALWGGGAYVAIGPGGADTLTVTAPAPGRYLLELVVDRQLAPPEAVGVEARVDGSPIGVDPEGGAGAQGVSPNPDYLWIDTIPVPGELSAGTHRVTLAYAGQGALEARVDAVILQPVVESRLLAAGDGSRLALYKSLSGAPATATLPAGVRGWRVSVYDGEGRQVETVVAPAGGTVTIPAFGSALGEAQG